MQHDGVGRIVGAVGAEELGGQSADGKRRRNLHHRAEQQLGLHLRQGEIEQLLHGIADAVDHSRLINFLVEPLQAGQKGKEPGAHAHPNGDKHHHAQYVLGIQRPFDRLGNQPHADEHVIDKSVRVGGEKIEPDGAHGHPARDGGGVEGQGEHIAQLFQVADEPRHDEGGKKGDRAGNHREQQGVFQGDEKLLVVQNQQLEIGDADDVGRFHHIVVGQAQRQGYQHRHDGEQREQHQEGGHEQIPHFGVAISPHRFLFLERHNTTSHFKVKAI